MMKKNQKSPNHAPYQPLPTAKGRPFKKNHAGGLCLIALLLFTIPVHANLIPIVCPTGQTLYYKVTNHSRHTAEVTGGNINNIIGVLIIPDSVVINNTTYTVTSIGQGAFYQHTGLTEVTIPSTVSAIANETFFYCQNLTRVNMPSTITSIGRNAFYNCNLDTVIVPDAVNYIGANAFRKCSNLSYIKLGASLYATGHSVFRECTSLTSIILPNGLNTISNYAFYECTALTAITIPNSAIYVGHYAFQGCTALQDVTIGNHVISIDYDAFTDCTSLTNITIPASVESMGERIFYGCTQLDHVYMDGLPPAIIDNTFDINDEGEQHRVVVSCDFDSIYRHTAPWDNLDHLLNDCNDVSIDPIATNNYRVTHLDDRVVIQGVAGHTIRLFDNQGRLLHKVRANEATCELRVPATGLYFVRIDNDAARKIVIVR